jgi:ribosomal peptide maturation radical SAM protein 1
MDKLTVVLVVMPFFPIQIPSLGVGLLKSSLMKSNIDVKVEYLNLDFAELLNLNDYIWISDGQPARTHLVGEFIFSHTIPEPCDIPFDDYLNVILKAEIHKDQTFIPNDWTETIYNISCNVDKFLDVSSNKILKHKPHIVALSSMFQSHAACISFASKLKEKSPGIKIILGGSNCDGAMGIETAKCFSCIDAIVTGDGEEVLPKLCEIISKGNQDISDLRGTVYYKDGKLTTNQRAVVQNLDAVPFPNYDDFFDQLSNAKFNLTDDIARKYIMLESSRGCWWGQKYKCVFCGLNGATIGYRSKSATRMQEEYTYFQNKYPGYPIALADNILDYKYFEDLIPWLTENNRTEIFVETKANIKRSHAELLKAAGITRIQPGIESLSSSTLRIMKKGTTALQNIQALKHCEEFGIVPVWGILYGIPHEDPIEYSKMADLIPLISHLPPPEAVGRIRLDRFSSLFENYDNYDLTNVRPVPAYGFVYNKDHVNLNEMAYFFDYDYANGIAPEEYAKCVSDAKKEWLHCYEESTLFHVIKDDVLIICDTRPCRDESMFTITSTDKEIYLSCSDAITLEGIKKRISIKHPMLSLKEILSTLERLQSKKILLFEGNQYLSLSIQLGPYSPRRKAVKKIIDAPP